MPIKKTTETASKVVKKKVHRPQKEEFGACLGSHLEQIDKLRALPPIGKIIPNQVVKGVHVEVIEPTELDKQKALADHYREQSEERKQTRRQKFMWLRNIGSGDFNTDRASGAIKKIMEIRGISLEALHTRLLYRRKVSITALEKFIKTGLLSVDIETVMEIARLIDANPKDLAKYFVVDKVMAAKKSMNVLMAARCKKWFQENGWLYYKDGAKKPYKAPPPFPPKKKKGSTREKIRKTLPTTHERRPAGSNSNPARSSTNSRGNNGTGRNTR